MQLKLHMIPLATVLFLPACMTTPEPEVQKWYDIVPDITATLRWGADQRTYALGAVSDYRSPAGSDASTLVYVKRADGGTERIQEQTAQSISSQFGNVTLCEGARATLTRAEPPVYRRDLNSWAIALTCV